MDQRFVNPDSQDNIPVQQPGLLAELDDRRKQNEREAALRAAEQVRREQTIAVAESSLEAVNARIEELLSANPEEFVIRFLQTEGQ